MSRKSIVIIGVLVVVVVLVVIGVKAFTAPGAPGGMPEHITIAQAMAAGSGQVVKVGGEVMPGSVSYASGLLRFTLTGEGQNLPVVYRGVAPKDFKPGLALVVGGTYNAGGIFEATSLTSTNSPLCQTCHGQ